ncbi:GNAT family N-acetyltransferase [Desulfonema magnum]|uniref:GNAT domain-containing protein n=1 Tax=Desulfonema magnum TaxID=45655 RepID=A0A975BUH5_9BACT|nr:GNAT family N-acetyltransferase [Desulfonema magnum]QTA91727.1 GNAT domain-containing protein [Desulfonema magnum]
MNDNYFIRRAISDDDSKQLHKLFSEVFHPQDVGTLAETMFHHLPRMEKKYWFIAEDRNTSAIVSAFALIPWTWEMEGIRLKVAEMGIVGTRKEYQEQGLMRILNKEFDKTLAAEKFDLAVIQGIPGFYHNFGYHYAVAMENHINMPLHIIPDEQDKDGYTFRIAGLKDIPYLMEEDESYRKFFSVSAFRDEANWKYLFGQSLKTEYGSEFWIMENKDKCEKFCFRIPQEGFGKGLIISEISAYITYDALIRLFTFCKHKAAERNKPYIRLNLHNESMAGKTAISMGAEKGNPYAWQIKFADRINFLRKIAPILEKRMKESLFKNFSGTVRLDFFKTKADMIWNEGILESVKPGEEEACDNTFCISEDLFPALCLGHRTWQELQHTRPDIFPASQYLRPNLTASDKSGLLTDTLFPSGNSWIYEQY